MKIGRGAITAFSLIVVLLSAVPSFACPTFTDRGPISLSLTPPSSILCAPQEIEFIAAAQDPDYENGLPVWDHLTYRWSIGSGTQSETSSTMRRTFTRGTYDISVTVDDQPRYFPDDPVTATVTIVVQDPPDSVTISKPACDGEYVNETTLIKVYASGPDGVSEVKFFVDDTYKGNFWQESGYWRFDWLTDGTEKGVHTTRVEAYTTAGCKTTASRSVFAHPLVRISQISFEDDHLLYDRVGQANIVRPQWIDTETGPVSKPVAYTRNSGMTVKPKFISDDVTGTVDIKYDVTLHWSDETDPPATKTQAGVNLPYELAHYPTARDAVRMYGCNAWYNIYVRKCSDSDWALAGWNNPYHTVFTTYAAPRSPWNQSTEPVWSRVLFEADIWAAGVATDTEVTLMSKITKGLHSGQVEEHSPGYSYNGGKTAFSVAVGQGSDPMAEQDMFLNRWLDTKWGNCADFGNYLALMGNGLGIETYARRCMNSYGPTFGANPFYAAGSTDLTSNKEFTYHQYGLRDGRVYDGALKFSGSQSPPAYVVEYQSGVTWDYESALVESYNSGGGWDTRDPQVPTVRRETSPTISGVGIKDNTLTQTSATIKWLTNFRATSKIYWDDQSHAAGTPEQYQHHSDEYPSDPNNAPELVTYHEVPIGDVLTHDKTYYYRVESSGAVSPESSFHTLP